ncbi:hypothetical protein VQ02_18830 [Methylobacterium variabile]|jgi:diguanylate cyclase (GGDEF)-like protein|uniref:diguanylate cyclase n=1 Tax=Methylobacterium variabile TaxID=298794 RepID=A0A0J6SMK1_9HYPH|nr:GGDEF domain-containing protein [Methylobacterium variabile]KMO34613.1 hypothetical protein VQ02_18830 [Methylobacterium variabile]
MALDVSTLLFAGVTARCCYVLVFLVSGLRPRAESCLLHWGASVACSIGGTLIHYGDGGGPALPPLTGALAHGLFGSSIVLCWTGMRRFHGRQVDGLGTILAALLPSLAYVAPAWFGFGPDLGLAAVFAILAVMIVATVREILRSGSGGAEWSRYVAAGGLTVYLMAFVASIILLVADREVVSDGRNACISLLIDQACSVLIYVGFLAMAGERSNARLSQLATTDPLTGLANRRGVTRAVSQAMTRTSPRRMAVVLADIDHFKAINDDHGHEAGDLVLAEFAARMRRATGGDLLARWGGEEFLAVLPEEAAEAEAEQIRAATEAEPFRVGAGGLRVTVSIGVATSADGFEAALRRADAALYAAKRGGRNRVVCAAPEPGPAPRASRSAGAGQLVSAGSGGGR